MSVYDRLRSASKRLIDKFGQTAVYIRNTNPEPSDVSKPWVLETNSVQTKSIKIVFIPDDRDNRETKNYSRRSLVQKGNTSALTYGLDFEPQLKDTIQRGSKIYTIESIIEVKPDDSDVILYKMRLS